MVVTEITGDIDSGQAEASIETVRDKHLKDMLEQAGMILALHPTSKLVHRYRHAWTRFFRHLEALPTDLQIENSDLGIHWEGQQQTPYPTEVTPPVERIVFHDIQIKDPQGRNLKINPALTWQLATGKVGLERGGAGYDISEDVISQALAAQIDKTAQYYNANPAPQIKSVRVKDR